MSCVPSAALTLLLLVLTCGEALADPVFVTSWTDADGDGIPVRVDPNDAVLTQFPQLGSVVLDLGGPYDLSEGDDLQVLFTLSDAVTSESSILAFALGDLFEFNWSAVYEFGDSGDETESSGTAAIPAGFFTDAGWDLNKSGSYTLHAQLFSGGTASQVVSATVTVGPPPAVPEPGTLALFGLGVGGLVVRRRTRGRGR